MYLRYRVHTLIVFSSIFTASAFANTAAIQSLANTFEQASLVCQEIHKGVAGALFRGTCVKSCKNAAMRTRNVKEYGAGKQQMGNDLRGCILGLDFSKTKPPILATLKQIEVAYRNGAWPPQRASNVAARPTHSPQSSGSSPILMSNARLDMNAVLDATNTVDEICENNFNGGVAFQCRSHCGTGLHDRTLDMAGTINRKNVSRQILKNSVQRYMKAFSQCARLWSGRKAPVELYGFDALARRIQKGQLPAPGTLTKRSIVNPGRYLTHAELKRMPSNASADPYRK